jgi:hypothetical protein
MSWIHKNPFADGKDPTEHMIALIAAEAERSGSPLTEAEKVLLLSHWDPETTVSEEFRSKAKNLIQQTLSHEADPDSPRSLGNSVEWAGDQQYPTIVGLTEEVLLERSEKPRLGSKRRLVDLVQLVGCGLVVVILLMLFGAFVDWFFEHR